MEDIRYSKEEEGHRRSGVISMLAKGISAAATLGALFRYFDAGRYVNAASVLNLMGLRRRRSAWGTLALIGAGVATGAGIAMFVSPRSGRDTRQGLFRQIRNLGERGRHYVQSARGGEAGHDGGRQREGQRSGERQGDVAASGGRQAAGAAPAATSIHASGSPGSMGVSSAEPIRGR